MKATIKNANLLNAYLECDHPELVNISREYLRLKEVLKYLQTKKVDKKIQIEINTNLFDNEELKVYLDKKWKPIR